MRIAKWAKTKNIKVVYYISPQIWAWKQKRVYLIKKVVDELYCILPFEEAFYQKFDHAVNFVGHPLIDAIENFKKDLFNAKDFNLEHQLNDKPILALLPGSRKQEIRLKLPLMWKAAQQFVDDFQVVVAGAPNQSEFIYQEVVQNKEVKVISGATYEVLSVAHLALVTSGTATLETALFKVPQVVCYKASWVSYLIAKQLIKVKYISLVNLIMDEEIVRELIQGDCTPQNMRDSLQQLIRGKHREQMLDSYDELERKLGGKGASERVAQLMLKKIQKR
jgi:lipid-A-disaccharide synthase